MYLWTIVRSLRADFKDEEGRGDRALGVARA
jgi:hypothetical protein